MCERRSKNAGLAKLGFKEIRANQRENCRRLHNYVGDRDVLREKPDVPHHLCIGFLQRWQTRSCRHSLPRFPFGFTNDKPSVDPSRERGQSRCLGPRNFRDRNKQIKAASEGKYNLVFTSPEALFGSHRSSISALKKKIQAVFIDEVHCVAKWLVFFFHVTLVSVL